MCTCLCVYKIVSTDLDDYSPPISDVKFSLKNRIPIGIYEYSMIP